MKTEQEIDLCDFLKSKNIKMDANAKGRSGSNVNEEKVAEGLDIVQEIGIMLARLKKKFGKKRDLADIYGYEITR